MTSAFGTRIDTLSYRLDVDISFVIDAGRPRFLRNVKFEGLEGLMAPPNEYLARPEGPKFAAKLLKRTDFQGFSL